MIMNPVRHLTKARGTLLSSTWEGAWKRDSGTTSPRGYGQKAGIPSIITFAGAGVAELADAVALGATGRKSLEVQILSPAPNQAIFSFSRHSALLARGVFRLRLPVILQENEGHKLPRNSHGSQPLCTSAAFAIS